MNKPINLVPPPVYPPVTPNEHGILREFSGYAVQWGVYGAYGEFSDGPKTHQFCFLRGCFDEGLARGDEVVLTEDCRGVPIYARRSDGSLTITSDDRGLLVTARLKADNVFCPAAVYKIDNHLVKGWSHVCAPGSDKGRRWRKDGITYDDYFKATLAEVSLVVNKHPRMDKTLPAFIYGGPKEPAPCV